MATWPLASTASPVLPTSEIHHAWVETYRAALLEIDPLARLNKIREAYATLRYNAVRPLDPREKDAIDDAREVLAVLREGIEGRAAQRSWLL